MLEEDYNFIAGDIVIPVKGTEVGDSLYYRVENSTQGKALVEGVWWDNSKFKLVFRPTFANVNLDTLENIVKKFIEKEMS